MATNTQFSIAVHLMAGLGCGERVEITSAELARSINTSPSFVRRILAKLSKANLVRTTTGKFGYCCLSKQPEDISMLEIYQAVDAPKVFSIHDYPAQQACKVSCCIKDAIKRVLDRAQTSVE